MSVMGSSKSTLKEIPGRLDPLGSPGEGWIIVQDVCGAEGRPGHHLVVRPEHPLGGGTTMEGSGGICS